ncbi:Uncharacterized protein dnm_029010 [Desulfonema magnum]|uniref:Uncharacterized protein n=1 Tax=Desulfonema magnum TaxID=45655 RepID=A0A975GMG4_9BACT|nr:Uncharacterized protein dnm_029010 [Desulfonema magnum]
MVFRVVRKYVIRTVWEKHVREPRAYHSAERIKPLEKM